MKFIRLILIILGACTPSILLSQNNNRISLQTGLFHSFFDGSAIINKKINSYKRVPRNLFGGVLNDSKGFSYLRKINTKSNISVEYMVLNTGYDYNEVINNSGVKPVISTRNLKYVNLTYSRNIHLQKKIEFVYGGGANYLWGYEGLYHYTAYFGWGEPSFYGYYRHDFGVNLRTGVEYSPLKWLTLFTNFDFIGIVYLGAKDVDGIKVENYYKDKYDLKNIPSRFDLSWRFGIGFNFLK